MSVVFSGTNQGSFTSDGTTKILQIRADVDWLNVYNTTIAAANQTTAVGVQYYWQRGFPAGAQWEYFTLVNNTINVPGASVALTSITNATPPVVATGNTAGLAAGDVVRIFNTTGGQQLGGLDFTIGTIITNTSFTLAFMRAIAAATTGTFRRIPYDPYFYPPTRVISKISQATQAIVTFTVTHAYTVGQKIRFIIPTVSTLAYGMVELNGVEATIVAINQADTNGVTNTVTIDVDTSGFTAFAWPLTADPVHTPAQVVPVGENTAQAIASGTNILGDSEVNQGYIGIALTGGAGSPGGANAEVIYWVAGKSFSGGA